MKKYRAAIVLSVVLLTLVGIAYWDERQTKKDEETKAQENRIFSIKSDEIARITFTEPGKNVSFELVKENGKWQLTGGVNAAADATAVDGFIKTLIDYKFEKVVSDAKSKWSEFGVENPQRTITIVDGTGKTEQVFVGSQSPVGYNAFFRTDDSGKVYVGSQYLITSTGKTAQEFRDKSIPSVDSAEIQSFRYLVGGEQIFRAERQDGKFVIVEPSGLDSDHSELTSFLSDVTRTKAEEFNDAPTAEFTKAFESAKAAFAFEWTTEKGEKSGWRVAAVKEDFWVKSQSATSYYKLSSDSVKSLKKELKDFRNRQIANYDTNDVVAAEIDGKAFEKKDSNFFEKDGKEPKQYVQNFVSDIAWSKAENFVEAGSNQAKVIDTPPAHKISLTFDPKSKHPVLSIEVWKDPTEPNKFVLRSSDAKSLLVVGKDVLSNIKPPEGAGQISGLEEQPASNDVDKGS